MSVKLTNPDPEDLDAIALLAATKGEGVREALHWRMTAYLLGFLLAVGVAGWFYWSAAQKPDVWVTAPGGNIIPIEKATLQSGAEGIARLVVTELNNYSGAQLKDVILRNVSYFSPTYRQAFLGVMRDAVGTAEQRGEIRTFSATTVTGVEAGGMAWKIRVSGNGFFQYGITEARAPYEASFVVTVRIIDGRFQVSDLRKG